MFTFKYNKIAFGAFFLNNVKKSGPWAHILSVKHIKNLAGVAFLIFDGKCSKSLRDGIAAQHIQPEYTGSLVRPAGCQKHSLSRRRPCMYVCIYVCIYIIGSIDSLPET